MNNPGAPTHDPDAAAFPFLHTVAVEATSACNLRCTYCLVSQPGYESRQMAPAMVREIIEECRARAVEQLCINGHGETTILPGWTDLFAPYASEFKLSLTSNLARAFDAAEVEFLSRLHCLNVSVDIADPGLLKQIRHSLDLQVVERNIAQILTTCRLRRKSPPALVLYAGVYDRSVLHLPSLAEFAAANRFSHVVFWSLVQPPDLPGKLNVRPLSALAPEAAGAAIAAIGATIERLDALGIRCEFVGDFFEVFKRQTAGRGRPAAGEQLPAPMSSNRIYETATDTQTKDCFDPWTYSQVKATGEVFPCCAHSSIGTVTADRSYGEILEGEPLRRLRRSLLTGTLDDDCRHCHMRPNIPVTAFRARHAQEFAAGSGVAPWHRAAGLQGDRAGANGSRWPQRLRSRISLVWKSLRARLHGATGSLDQPLEGSACRTSVLVEGWFFALRPAAATGRVWIDGQVVAELALDQDRPDVRAALRPLDPPLRCGFRQRVALPERLRSDGAARLWVEVWTGSRRAMRLGPVRITTTRR